MTAAAELLSPGGECAVCKRHAGERVLVAVVEAGSGPGWLAEDLAIIDAERQQPQIELRRAP